MNAVTDAGRTLRRLWWSSAYYRDPTAFFARMGRGPRRVDTLGGKFVSVADPAIIKEIYTGDPDRFDVAKVSTDALGPLVGPNSLILLSGARHRRERKLLTPPFHGARMRAYGEAMRAAAVRHTGAWDEGSARRPDARGRSRPHRLQDTTQAISLDVIVETVFGVRDPGRRATLASAIDRVVNGVDPLTIFYAPLRRRMGGLSPWGRFMNARDRLVGLLREEIAARRADPGEDITSLMVLARTEDGECLSDDEVVDEMMTLLIAGHETTGIALAWAIYQLLRDAPALTRLRAELDEHRGARPDEVAKLPYLGHVCDEVLRLHPIVPDVTRHVVRDCTIGGEPFARDEVIAIAITEVHRDPVLYPRPQEFRPDRFAERKFKPWEYLPFGGGTRRCLGAAFAGYEMRIVLAEIVGSYELALAEDRPLRPVRRNITMGPEGGVPFVVVGRRG